MHVKCWSDGLPGRSRAGQRLWEAPLGSQAAYRAQEVAGNHAVSLWGRTEAGYATDPIMVERNLIFAATRIQIEMDTYPKWCASGPLASALNQERRAPQLAGDATEAGAQRSRRAMLRVLQGRHGGGRDLVPGGGPRGGVPKLAVSRRVVRAPVGARDQARRPAWPTAPSVALGLCEGLSAQAAAAALQAQPGSAGRLGSVRGGGRARSTWVMVNTVTRRLAKMPDEMRVKMEYMAPHPHRRV